MRTLGLTLSAALLAPAVAGAQSPWLPPEGELSINPSYRFETYDEYFFGSGAEDLPFDVDRHVILATVEYGILENLAVDFTSGYVDTKSSQVDDDDGLADTTIGLRYRVLDEFKHDFPDWVPTLTVRLGGVIEGTYERFTIEAPGKGSSGVDGSLLIGKVLGDSGFRVFADTGYRVYANEASDEFFVGVGVARTFFDAIDLSVTYRHLESLSGPAVDDITFPRERYPERRESADTVEIGLGFETLEGRYFAVSVGKTVAGESTADMLMFGFSAFLPF